LGSALNAEGDDRQRARYLPDPGHGIGSACVGKAKIQEDDVRLVFGDEVDSFRACGRDAGDKEALPLEQRADTETHHRVILNREDPNPRVAGRRRLNPGMSEKPEGVRRACRERLLTRLVGSVVPRDLGTPLAFENIDPVDGNERAGYVAGDRVEHGELLTEALIPQGSFDVEDS